MRTQFLIAAFALIALSGCDQTRGMFGNAWYGEPMIQDRVWVPDATRLKQNEPPSASTPNNLTIFDSTNIGFLPPACWPVPDKTDAGSTPSDGSTSAVVVSSPKANKPAGAAEDPPDNKPTPTVAAPSPKSDKLGAAAAGDPTGDKPAAVAASAQKPGTPAPTASTATTVTNVAYDPYAKWSPPDINNCTFAMKELIDVRFAHYQDSLLAANSSWNTATDLAIVGMGAAGGLIGGTTSQILNAANSALAGAQGKINSDVLYSHSINIILQQMKSDRTAQAIVIETKIKNNSYKNMYDAATDLYAYARAGSWSEALLSLESSAGSQAADCTAQEQKNQIAAAQGTTSANVSSSTTSSKCQPTTSTRSGLSLTDKTTVENIQTALNNHNANPKVPVTGLFLKLTLAALNKFQTANSLPLTPSITTKTLDSATATALGLQSSP